MRKAASADRDTAHPYSYSWEAWIPYDEHLLLRGQVVACPVDFLPAAFDCIRDHPAGVHGHPSAVAAEEPDGQDIHNVLPSDEGAFAAPGEDHSFGMKIPCPRMASC